MTGSEHAAQYEQASNIVSFLHRLHQSGQLELTLRELDPDDNARWEEPGNEELMGWILHVRLTEYPNGQGQDTEWKFYVGGWSAYSVSEDARKQGSKGLPGPNSRGPV